LVLWLAIAEKLLAVPPAAEPYMVSKPSFSALSRQGKEQAYGRAGLCARSASPPDFRTACAPVAISKKAASDVIRAGLANRSRVAEPPGRRRDYFAALAAFLLAAAACAA
jgi:hypothetical protein